MSLQRLYTVRYEPSASRAIEDAKLWYPGIEDALLAIDFALARDKSIGQKLKDEGVIRAAFLCGAQSIKMPSITILYEVQDIFERIVVHSMRFEDGPSATIH